MLLANMVAECFKISASEARRKIEEGAVRINDCTLTRDPTAEIWFVENQWIVKAKDVGNLKH